MRTTIDIPDAVMKHTMMITGAPTKRSAIITALEDYNRRHRMAGLVGLLGTCKDMITPAQLQHLRKAEGKRA